MGAPILKGQAVHGRLSLLHAHDALCLLRNVLAMPKLLYLMTAPCTGSKLLKVFDYTQRKGLTSILNVDISDDQWIQASLLVRLGGLGVRSAEKLAPSAFFASAASTFSLQNDILAGSILSFEDKYTSDTSSHGKASHISRGRLSSCMLHLPTSSVRVRLCR